MNSAPLTGVFGPIIIEDGEVWSRVFNGFYTTSSGSSFAAPYVTGTIGLMLSQTPCLTVFEIESILKSTADSLDQLNQVKHLHQQVKLK